MTRLKFWIISTTNSLQSCEREVSEWTLCSLSSIGVKSDLAFCLRSLHKKTNSDIHVSSDGMYDTYFIQFKGSINPQKINWSCKNQISLSFLLLLLATCLLPAAKGLVSYVTLSWGGQDVSLMGDLAIATTLSLYIAWAIFFHFSHFKIQPISILKNNNIKMNISFSELTEKQKLSQ